MDTGKLLNVIENIKKDEKDFTFQNRIQNILNFYNENNPDQLNQEKESLYNDLEICLVNNFATTDRNLLNDLNIDKYFSISAKQNLDEILNSQAHEVRQKLENFINERSEALSKIENIEKSLFSINIKSNHLEDDKFEVGFSFPEQYLDLENLEKVLCDIKLFLAALAEAKGGNESFKIRSVNNGCIEVFIEITKELAKYLGIVLDYFLEIYGAIKAFQELKKGYDNYVSKNKKTIDQANKDELNSKYKSIIDGLIKKLKIEEPEKKTKVTLLFKKLLKHFEKGVSAEIRTPSIDSLLEEPKEDSSKEEKDQYNKNIELFNIKKEIDLKNKEIFLLQNNNFSDVNLELIDDINKDTE